MKITTCFGYFVKNGKKIGKYELPVGNHPDPKGCDFIEVSSKEELSNITIDKTDDQIAAEQAHDTNKQIKANRDAYIDALMSGDVQAQTDLKDAQAFLVRKVKVDG